jgi:hypothetical protein
MIRRTKHILPRAEFDAHVAHVEKPRAFFLKLDTFVETPLFIFQPHHHHQFLKQHNR